MVLWDFNGAYCQKDTLRFASTSSKYQKPLSYTKLKLNAITVVRSKYVSPQENQRLCATVQSDRDQNSTSAQGPATVRN